MVKTIDREMAGVTWMVNQNIDKLGDEEMAILTPLFKRYCDHARGDKAATREVQNILDVILGREQADVGRAGPKVHLQQPIGVFAMHSDDEGGIPEREQVMMYGHDVSTSVRSRKQLKKAASKKRGALKAAVHNHTTAAERDKVFQGREQQAYTDGAIAMERNQEKLMAMIKAQMDAAQQFAEQQSGETKALHMELIDLSKENNAIRRDLHELHEMNLRKESLLDINWSQVPDWFREKYAIGMKNLAYSLVALPFRFAGQTVKNVIYKPMVNVFNFYRGWAEFVVGHVLWVIAIAGVVYIYKETDWDRVNQTFATYGGERMYNIVVGPLATLVDIVTKYSPSTAQLANSFKDFMCEDVLMPIFAFFYTLWQALGGMLTMAANAMISKIPFGSNFERDVSFGNSTFGNATRDYFLDTTN